MQRKTDGNTCIDVKFCKLDIQKVHLSTKFDLQDWEKQITASVFTFLTKKLQELRNQRNYLDPVVYSY